MKRLATLCYLIASCCGETATVSGPEPAVSLRLEWAERHGQEGLLCTVSVLSSPRENWEIAGFYLEYWVAEEEVSGEAPRIIASGSGPTRLIGPKLQESFAWIVMPENLLGSIDPECSRDGSVRCAMMFTNQATGIRVTRHSEWIGMQ